MGKRFEKFLKGKKTFELFGRARGKKKKKTIQKNILTIR